MAQYDLIDGFAAVCEPSLLIVELQEGERAGVEHLCVFDANAQDYRYVSPGLPQAAARDGFVKLRRLAADK